MSMKSGAGLIFAAVAALCQTPPAGPAFEVASIKPSPPIVPGPDAIRKLHIGVKVDAARVDIGFLTLADLIPLAFRVKAYQVSGPEWMPAKRFDIQATMPEGANKDQMPDMLQALLAERFKLAYHRETKEHAVLALLVGKKGPKLKEAPPETPPAPAGAAAGVEPSNNAAGSNSAGNNTVGNVSANNQDVHIGRAADGKVTITGAKTGPVTMSMNAGVMHLEAARMTMGTLADTLSRFLGRPVVDMTELKGNYQVALDFAMEDLRNMARASGMLPQGGPAGGEAARAPADAASDPSGSSVLASLQLLGLRLESRKAPIERIVIDHLEKDPTDN